MIVTRFSPFSVFLTLLNAVVLSVYQPKIWGSEHTRLSVFCELQLLKSLQMSLFRRDMSTIL